MNGNPTPGGSQGPLDELFKHHRSLWKARVYEEIKQVISIRKFIRPLEVHSALHRDDTPTGEKDRASHP